MTWLSGTRGIPNGPVATPDFDCCGSHYGVRNVTDRYDWVKHSRGGMDFFFVPMAVAAVLYVPVIVVGLEWFMRDRPALRLKVPLLLWNASLALFSLVGAIHTLPQLLSTVQRFGFAAATCDNRLYYTSTGYWVYWFCLSKVFEFVDTIFLRLRKRPVILLHWYHHICTMAYCWHGTYGIEHGADASGWFFAAMNLSVHAIMYSYYALASMGLHKPLQRAGFDMIITTMQITQMVIGVCVLIYSSDCSVINEVSWKWGLVMYASYFCLFVHMAWNKYFSGSAGAGKPKAEKAGAATTNGSAATDTPTAGGATAEGVRRRPNKATSRAAKQ